MLTGRETAIGGIFFVVGVAGTHVVQWGWKKWSNRDKGNNQNNSNQNNNQSQDQNNNNQSQDEKKKKSA